MSLRGRHDSKGQGKKSQREDSPKVLPPQESTLIAARLGQASITTPGHLEALADYSSELPIGDSSLNTSAHISPFEAIKRTGEHGNEFWRSREFASTLSYNDYTNFENVINKAKTACLNSGHLVEDHFRDVTEMIRIGKGGQRPFEGVWLSRYACYLIIQNADPSKDIVALGQTYFAVQTRRQELTDLGDERAIEEQRRLILRSEMRGHNVQLADAAKDAGIVETKDYAIFQNHGYRGLYGGLGAREIHVRKGLGKGQEILDYMGSAELAANLFRATQAEQKLRREGITGKANANRAHKEVGEKIRQTIKELGGTMPENLPTAESIKVLESRERKAIQFSREEDPGDKDPLKKP